MNNPKKILYIVSRLPINTETGDRLRVYHFIKKLTQKGHQVDVLGFVPAGKYQVKTDIFDLSDNCIGIEREGLEFENPSRRQQLKYFFSSLIHGYPYRVWLWHNQEFIDKALELISSNSYDVIHFSSPASGTIFRNIQAKNTPSKPRLVYDLIDSFSLSLKNALSQKLSFLWPFRLVDFIRLKKFEQQIVQDADETILISERDKQFLARDKITVIPNGVEANGLQKYERDIDLLFVGNMTTEPNIDAVQWFAQEVMPKLTHSNSTLKLYIAGTAPPCAVRELEDENIKVLGFVENIHEYYRRAKIFVCPMRLGAGQKNKILEAMINHTPVVSTTEGNFGIEAPSRAIAIADTSEAFVKKISILMNDKKGREQMGQNGYEFVSNNFSWDKSATLLEQCYKF